jgi:hypothetical protein
MANKIEQLTTWLEKDQIASQIALLSESSDWYRGGRKIGNLRRKYKLLDKIDSTVDDLFAERIMADHQSYMDRLAVHKLKGPSNQQSLKDAESSRIIKQSELLQEVISQTNAMLADVKQELTASNKQNLDIEAISITIKEIERELSHKKNKITSNSALLDSLKSSEGFVSCSANIKIVSSGVASNPC